MQEYVTTVVTLLDAHQGSCMVLLTVALVVCSIASCAIAAMSIRLMRKLDEKRSSPYVVIEATQNIPYYGVRIVNMGQTAARNVTVETEPKLSIVFPQYQRPIGFISNRLDVIVPHKSYETDIGNCDQVKKDNPSQNYRCIVRYESEWGEKHTAEYVLDYTVYEHLIHKENYTLTDLTKKIAEFCREFGNLVNGSRKLHVLTEDYEAHQEKVMKAIEEQQVEQDAAEIASAPLAKAEEVSK